ncbi:MAG: DegQ family serine endoprotease [Alphaproteobacteria bacterium]
MTIGIAALGIVALLLSAGAGMARSAPDSFADLAEEMLPKVVSISTSQVVGGGGAAEAPEIPPGTPFEDLFRDFFNQNPRGNGDAPRRRAAAFGSGFIIDPSGYVVTNNHVIEDADEITVILHDDTRYPAKIIGRDDKTDIALLKIEPTTPLPATRWGDSTKARIGDWVVAIGGPFGLGGTVTAGIISSLKRNINAGPYDNFIQTDASINRGNSGGPMFNVDGEVIGVNTAIFSTTGGSVGIGFAVPSSIVQRVVTQLREFGRTKRGWLGVRIQTVTDEIAETIGLDEARGAMVASVADDGPARAAKIEPGDVVLTFDGKPVDSMRELPRIVAETPIGKEVDVEVWRKGKKVALKVTIGELDESGVETASARPDADAPEAQQTDIDTLGLTVTGISDSLREEFNLPKGLNGVLITGVAANGSAAEKGLRPGDVIVEVGQEEVRTPAEIAAKVDEARENGRKSVLLLVNRDGDLRFFAVRI